MKRFLQAAIGVSLALSGVLMAADKPAFTVGTATAVRGQKAYGFLEVPAGVDAGTRIAVAVVHGAKPGPVFAIVSGAHGTEYASIVAVSKLVQMLDPAQVSGTVILVPLVNVPSFEQKVPHVNPVDGKSMNRFYPGKADGTQTERASFLITREVVEKCDHLIDLHGGDLDEDLRPYSYWTKTGNAAQDATSREMVLAFGLDHIIISTDRPKDPAASRYLENNATTRGKPSITVEAGRAGTVEPEDVAALVDGCLSVMRYLKMLPGAPTSRRASRLDRIGQDGVERGRRAFLSARPPRHLRRKGPEDRVRHGRSREDGVRSPLAGRGRCPLHLFGAVDEEGRHDRQHRSPGSVGALRKLRR